MTFPKKLADEPGKNFWRHEDNFGAEENLVVVPFYHKNYNIGMHSHEFYEINIITSGSGCHYFENMSFPIHAGDVFVIPPYVKHGYYNGGNLDVFHILIARKFMNKNHYVLSKTPGFSALFEIEPHLRKRYDKRIFLHLSPPEMIALTNELDELTVISGKKYFDVLNVYVLKTLCNLCMKMDEFGEKPSNIGFETDIIRVMEYIKNNPGEKHSLKTLAGIAKMSVPTLNRHFNKISGMSPMEYVKKCRINLAKYMIDEGKRTKTEIAQICGFYDLSHMDKFLK